MREGVMYHEEFARAYNFLGLWGFSKCQVSHCKEEKENYQCLLYYYATHYFKLIQEEEIKKPEIIPTAWYKYTAQAVDTQTKRQSVKDLMTKWINWEKETKKFYQEMRQELMSINEHAAATYLDRFIEDVTKELSHAEKKLLKFESINYDIIILYEISEEMDKKYTKKLGW